MQLSTSSVNTKKILQRRKQWNRFKLFLYVMPGIAILFLFHYAPLWGWIFAFFQYKPGIPLMRSKFVGWENFYALFGNPVMRRNLFMALENTFGIHLLGYLFTPLPMLFAVFLSEIRSKRYQKFTQTITTLPHFISWVIVFSLATTLFSTNGLVNNILMELGSVEKPIPFLTTDKHVWITQVLWQQWKETGWHAIVYFASIAGIDIQLYEAAMVDGAGRMRRIWNITLPQLIPTYFVLLIMSIGNFLNTGVDQFLVFGNSLNKEFIQVLDLYVYNLGIGSGQISYSIAVGMMKSVVALVLFSIANIASKKIRGESVF